MKCIFKELIAVCVLLGFFTSVFAGIENDTTSISANPAATNILAGSGVIQQIIEQKLGITDNI